MDQDKHTKLLNAFKYPTLFMFGLFVALLAAGLLRGLTLDATLVGRTRTLNTPTDGPRASFGPQNVVDGFSAPPSTHIVVTLPSDLNITRVTLFGGEKNDQERYWGYCFSGNENANKQKGYTGRRLYDGHFFYSYGERHAQDVAPADKGLIDFFNDATEEPKDMASEIEIFRGGETCYLMTSVALPVGLDSDRDEVNDRLEKDIGSDPQSPDSDGDTLRDDLEIFIMGTSPLSPDSDQDGIPDIVEDRNQNGRVDTFETSARSADTDRDGLCDGDGTGRGCTEGQTSPVKGEDWNQNGEVDPGESDPKRWDTDGNGVSDKDQKWLEYERSL